MTLSSLARVPVRSTPELTARWATVLGSPVFGSRSLWLVWLDAEGLMLPTAIPIDDLPARPERRLAAGLLDLHDAVVTGLLGATDPVGAGSHLALALCRPGRRAVEAADDAWAATLREVLDPDLDGAWSLHLAAGGRVTPLVDPRPGAGPIDRRRGRRNGPGTPGSPGSALAGGVREHGRDGLAGGD